MFWVPRSGRLGLGLSLLSYAGEVRLGIAADRRRMGDPQALLEDFLECADELGVAGPPVAGRPGPGRD